MKMLPPKTRVYAIGDIHGRADLLKNLLVLIEEDGHHFPDDHKWLIFLGDYIDRGDDAWGVIELLLHLHLKGFSPIYLLGNHEDMMLAFLQDEKMGFQWLLNAGTTTLQSYFGETLVEEPHYSLVALQTALKKALPETHLLFLQNLALNFLVGEYYFVHAGIQPGTPLHQQTKYDQIWIREPFLSSNDDFGCVVVHGHTMSFDPVVKHNRIGIDTGAVHTGVLTCLVLYQQGFYFLQT